MREYFIEFDLVYYGYANGYYYADTRKELTSKVKEELKVWNGGHADVFDEEGEFLFDVEV